MIFRENKIIDQFPPPKHQKIWLPFWKLLAFNVKITARWLWRDKANLLANNSVLFSIIINVIILNDRLVNRTVERTGQSSQKGCRSDGTGRDGTVNQLEDLIDRMVLWERWSHWPVLIVDETNHFRFVIALHDWVKRNDSFLGSLQVGWNVYLVHQNATHNFHLNTQNIMQVLPSSESSRREYLARAILGRHLSIGIQL